jgi:hypothetical protein
VLSVLHFDPAGICRAGNANMSEDLNARQNDMSGRLAVNERQEALGRYVANVKRELEYLCNDETQGGA